MTQPTPSRQSIHRLNRGVLAVAAAATAVAATGCINHSRQTMSARSMNNGIGDSTFASFHQLDRPNVGAGDALGAASFGTDVTVAKAKQFGNFDFATGSVDFPED